MGKRTTLTTAVLGIGASLAGCVGPTGPRDFGGDPPQIIGIGTCFSTGGVRLDVNLGGGRPTTRLAVGETRTFAATVDSVTSGCSSPGDVIKRMEWFDSRNTDAKALKIRIHLQRCDACTLLYEDRPQSRVGEPVIGAALVNAGMRVLLEVKGLAPGPAQLELQGCTNDTCILAAWDRAFIQVE